MKTILKKDLKQWDKANHRHILNKIKNSKLKQKFKNNKNKIVLKNSKQMNLISNKLRTIKLLTWKNRRKTSFNYINQEISQI